MHTYIHTYTHCDTYCDTYSTYKGKEKVGLSYFIKVTGVEDGDETSSDLEYQKSLSDIKEEGGGLTLASL